MLFMVLLLIWRHLDNIKNILKGTENKIFLKNNETIHINNNTSKHFIPGCLMQLKLKTTYNRK